MLKLVSYLLGKGRRNEHKHPHLVAGSPELLAEIGGRELRSGTGGDAGKIARFLDEPMNAFGTAVTVAVKDADSGESTGERQPAHVWHCSLSLHPDDPAVGDGRWGSVVERFLTEMGFIGQQGVADCRYAAIHHGENKTGSDHVHVAVNLVREDGTVAGVHNDRSRSQKVATQIRALYGFRGPEGPTRGAGARGYKKGQLEADYARGFDVGDSRGELDRPEQGSQVIAERAVRAAAAAAASEEEFVALLRAEDIMVLPYYAKGSRRAVTGYKVKVRSPTGEWSRTYAGGKLSKELTLPRLREGWPALDEEQQAVAWRPERVRERRSGRPLAAPSLEQLERVSTDLADLRDRLRKVPVGEIGTWAQISRETAGVLAAASLRVEPVPGELAHAAREVARSGQLPAYVTSRRRWQSLPPAANAAQLFLSAGLAARYSGVLMMQLLDLATALKEMHDTAGDAQRAEDLAILAEQELELAQAVTCAIEVEDVSWQQHQPGDRVERSTSHERPGQDRSSGPDRDTSAER